MGAVIEGQLSAGRNLFQGYENHPGHSSPIDRLEAEIGLGAVVDEAGEIPLSFRVDDKIPSSHFPDSIPEAIDLVLQVFRFPLLDLARIFTHETAGLDPLFRKYTMAQLFIDKPDRDYWMEPL